MVFHESSIFLQNGATPTNVVGFWPFGDRNFGGPSFGHIHVAGLETPSKTFSNRFSYVSFLQEIDLQMVACLLTPMCIVVVSEGVWRPNFGQHIEISRTIL